MGLLSGSEAPFCPEPGGSAQGVPLICNFQRVVKRQARNPYADFLINLPQVWSLREVGYLDEHGTLERNQPDYPHGIQKANRYHGLYM
jgi:hypothetical protein